MAYGFDSNKDKVDVYSETEIDSTMTPMPDYAYASQAQIEKSLQAQSS